MGAEAAGGGGGEAAVEHHGAGRGEDAVDPELGRTGGGEATVDPELGGAQVSKAAAAEEAVAELSDDAGAWNIDGSNGHYHSMASLCLVMGAQINYIVSLVVIIPTAADYAASLGNTSSIYFGLVVGISSIIDPMVSRLWTSVIKATSFDTVLQVNACICLVCSLMYALAGYAESDVMLLASRCLLGLGSVQTAKLQYLGCAVSTKKVAFTHLLTTAAISYGFAFGALLAFLLSLVASCRGWDQNTLPGWFTAWLWLMYLALHRLVFVEPDKQAGIVDPASRIRLSKGMRPKRAREPFSGLVPCFLAIFVIAVVKGAFEVMTIELTKELWQWEVMSSALYLGGVMIFVALTTLLSYPLAKHVGEGRLLLYGLIGASLLLPFFYIPTSSSLKAGMGSLVGKAAYLVISILALSSLNLGRSAAFTLATELPSPHWRGHFLSIASQLFTMGRGVGPILAGAFGDGCSVVSVLLCACAVAAAGALGAFSAGRLEHKEHEVGPEQAEEAQREEDDVEAFIRSMDAWLSGAQAFPEAKDKSASKLGTPGAAAQG